jgi:hypothetical protein
MRDHYLTWQVRRLVVVCSIGIASAPMFWTRTNRGPGRRALFLILDDSSSPARRPSIKRAL